MGFLVLLIVQISLSLISAAIAKARAGRAARTASSGPGEIKAPIAEQGTPIPIVYGTTKIKGPNVIGKFGDQWVKTDGIYDYYANLQLGLCWGPAALKGVYLSDTGKANVELLQKWEPAGNWTPIASTVDFGINTYTVQGSGSVTIQCPVAQLLDVMAETTHWDLSSWGDSNADNYPVGTIVVAFSHASTANQDAKRNRPEVGIIVKYTVGLYDYNGIAIVSIPAGTIAYLKTATTNIAGGVLIPAGYIRYDGMAWKQYSPAPPPGSKLPKWCETYCVANSDDTAGVKVNGDVRFYPGMPDQGVDPFLVDSNGKGPRFPGLCQIVFASGDKRSPYKNQWFYWGQSPQLPQLAYEVARFPDPLGLGAASKINSYDANPANIVYDLLTNSVYGLRKPTSKCDTASYIACGQKLAAEGIGMSLLLDKSSSFDSVVEDICKTIDGAHYQDPQTGLWTMSLIRKDYVVEDLQAFGPGDYMEPPEIVRSMDTANQVSVTYCSREGGYSNRTVRADDVAGYQSMGELVQIGNTYQGVTQESTAFKLAARDLRVYSQPIAKITLKLNRRGWKLRPGSAFVLNDPENGISGMVCRVATINYGTIDNPSITVEALEDVFGVPLTSYIPPSTNPTDSNKTLPSLPQDVALWEVPYPMTGATESIQVAALAAPGDNASTMSIYTDDAATGQFSDTGKIPSSSYGYTPSGQLSAALTNAEERTDSVTLQGLVGFDSYDLIGGSDSGKNLLLIGDELMSFGQLAYNNDDTITLHDVLRGVLDTIPNAHAIGSRAWFVRNLAMINDPYTTDGTHHAKVTAGNQAGMIQPTSVPAQSITTHGRQALPYPPGKFRVGDGASYADTVSDGRVLSVDGGLLVSWAPRNRLSQSGAVAQDATGITSEDHVGVQIELASGINGTLYHIDQGTSQYTVTLPAIMAICASTLDGISLQMWSWRSNTGDESLFSRHSGMIEPVGYGIGYGRYYGGPEN